MDTIEGPISSRDRWLALALLIVACSMLYFWVIEPVWVRPLVRANSELADARRREQAVQMQLAQADEVRVLLQRASLEATKYPGFLPEATPEQGVAGLVRRLEMVVAEASPGNASCLITNRSPLPVGDDGRFPRVSMQIRMRCGMTELAKVLYALESQSPRTYIDNLTVLSQRGPLGQPGSAGGLDIRFELSGYLLPTSIGPQSEHGVSDAN